MTRNRRWILGLLLFAIDLMAAFVLLGDEGAWLGFAGILTPAAYLAASAWLGSWSLRGNPRLATRRALPLLAALDTLVIAFLVGALPSLEVGLLALAGTLILRELVFGLATRIPGPSVRLEAGERALDSALEQNPLGGLRRDAGHNAVTLTVFHDENGRTSLWRGPGGLSLSRPDDPVDGTSGRAKRNVDVLCALSLIPACLPVAALIALWVRVVDGPPVFYRQTRLTVGQRRFPILKFRSMRRDAETGGAPCWPVAEDPRSTRTGLILRRLWLDELPQLVQVLVGDLSFVGPRPERPEFAQVFLEGIPMYRLRYRSLAGITGLAQACGYVGNTSLRKRALCDRIYIERWSPFLDVWIVLATLGQMIRRTERRQFEYMPGRDVDIP